MRKTTLKFFNTKVTSAKPRKENTKMKPDIITKIKQYMFFMNYQEK